MGWTYFKAPKGASTESIMAGEYANTWKGVIASACKGGALYAVCEADAAEDKRYEPDANGKIRLCLVFLINRRAGKDGYNFGYKDMQETMGPYECGCPDRILDLLSPTTSEDANDWRQRCRAANAKAKSALKLRDGMIVKLPEAITFTNGAKHDTFTVRFSGKKVLFYADGGAYRLRKENKESLTEAVAA
jgi:hypothetical protein